MKKDIFGLEGKVAIVTGGAGMLGSEYCRAFAEAAAHVVVADLRGGDAKECANEINAEGYAKAIAVETDVTDKFSVQQMVARTFAEFGRIDILVNNAALDPKFDTAHADKHTNSFEDYPLELWNQSLGVDLTGIFLCAQAAGNVMLEQHSGVIINICSTYGVVGPDQRLYERDDTTLPRTYKPITYSVTKSAVLGFTRYLATYWAGKNIRVNALTLGGVFNGHADEFVRRYSYRTPLGRMAERSEYCGALLFVASDASSYMTGSNLVVDGGWTAW